MANLTAPISDVAIANMAAGILDDVHITSFDDSQSALARFLAREYGYARDELLSSYPWYFAASRALLPVLSDSPEFGWDYAYQMPSNALVVLPLRKDGLRDGEEIPYEIEGRLILTDERGPLKVRYTKRESNAALFTPTFARALGARLALSASTSVTGKSSYLAKANELYQAALNDAKHTDSIFRGSTEYVQTPTSSSLTSVRGASWSNVF